MAALIYASTTGKMSMIEFDCTPSEEHNQAAEVTEHPVEVGVDIADHVRPRLMQLNLTGVITNTPVNGMLTDTTYIEDDVRPVGLIIGQPTPIQLVAPDFAKGGVAKQPGLTVPKTIRTAQIINGWVSPYKVPGTKRPAGTPEAFPTERAQVAISGGVGGTSFQALTPQDRVRACFDILMDLCRSGRQVRVITSMRDYEAMLITNVSAPVAGQDSIDFSITLTEVRYTTVSKGVPVIKRTKEKRAKKEESKGVIGTGYKLAGNPEVASSGARSAGLTLTGN